MCFLCGAEVENYCPDGCPACGAPCVGWIDSAGGTHEGGIGHMPDGTCCGECTREDCGECEVWTQRKVQRQRYMHWHCEECGNELEIWLDEIENQIPAENGSFAYERHHLLWHCTECGCDYENHWETQWGDSMESHIQRKFWG